MEGRHDCITVPVLEVLIISSGWGWGGTTKLNVRVGAGGGWKPAHDSPVPFSLLPLCFCMAHLWAEVVCNTPGLTLKHLPDGVCQAFSLCWVYTDGPRGADAELPWAPEMHIEAEQAANSEYSLDFTEARNNKPWPLVSHYAFWGFLLNLYGRFWMKYCWFKEEKEERRK